MIQAQELHKSFGNVRALRGVSFRAEDGSVTGLLGPNGAGKTTALRILYTILQPDSGSASIDGFDVVAEAVGFASRVRWADLVVTGEGRLDSQSAFGKTTAGVARAAQAANRRVIALAGSVDASYQNAAEQLFDAVYALTPDLATPDEAVARAADLLSQAAEALGMRLAGEP